MDVLDKLLEQKTAELYQNQNEGTERNPQQRNLYSKEEYQKILGPVINIIKENPDFTMEELREWLYQQSGIEQKVRAFIYERQELPGTVFSYGDQHYSETIVAGNSQECTMDVFGNSIPEYNTMSAESIFDLASITKLFTSLVISKLVSEGCIDLDAKITDYVPEMKGLENATVLDILTFKKVVRTGPIEQAKSFEEAREMLFDAYIHESFEGRNAYNDRNAMVLKYVIESATGRSFETAVKNLILKPLGLKETITSTNSAPLNLFEKIVSNNYCYRLLKDGSITQDHKVTRGCPFDEKARILMPGGLSAHAGIFSSVGDMSMLARAINDGTYLARTDKIGENKTGEVFNNRDGKISWKQHLGELSYSKNPIAGDSEVHHALSGRTIASAGWNCTQLTADPVNGIHFVIGGNKPHNRFAAIAPEQRDKIIEYENGKKTVQTPSGLEIPVSAYTAWTRDLYVRDPAIELAIQYQFLNEIYKNEKDISKTDHKIRTIGPKQ